MVNRKKNLSYLLVVLTVGIIILVGNVPKLAWAGSFDSCKGLTDFCKSSSNYSSGICIRLLNGHIRSGNQYKVYQANKKIFCYPNDMTAVKLREILLSWAARHPKYIQESASACFYYAMSDAFPCQ